MDRRKPTFTEEALHRVENAPVFVRQGIYKLMVKRARERDRRVITSRHLITQRVEQYAKNQRLEVVDVETYEVGRGWKGW